MYELFVAPFVEFEFMRRALVGVAALSLSAPAIGIFLVLRRMSLTGDAMAHAILPGVAVGYLVAGFSVGAMTLGGLGAGLLVTLLSGLLARASVLREDATLAVFYLVSLAAGVMIVSARGSNVDLFHVLFGNVLALDDTALLLLAAAATLTLVLLALFYRPLVLDTADPGFLRSVSSAGLLAHLVFLGLVVVNLVASFQALGTLLGVGLMIMPAAAARFWSDDVSAMIPIAAVLALVANAGGLLLSYHLDRETGPTMILTAFALVAVSFMFGRASGLVWRALPRRHLEA
jgi:zinc/manganese transport system permease protein